MRLSQTEGWGSRPSDPGLYPPGLDSTAPGWPPDIQSASVILTTHADAIQYVGGGTEAGDGSRPVLVIRLVGDFRWITTGPPGHGPAAGNVATIVVDATTGQDTDTGLESVNPPASLPGATLLYENPAVRASALAPSELARQQLPAASAATTDVAQDAATTACRNALGDGVVSAVPTTVAAVRAWGIGPDPINNRPAAEAFRGESGDAFGAWCWVASGGQFASWGVDARGDKIEFGTVTHAPGDSSTPSGPIGIGS